MQRKRYSPGRVPGTLLGLGAGLAVAVGALTGCSAADPAEDIAIDAKAGAAAVPVAPPGRYRTLFEPCGAVPQATLRDLLPGTAAMTDPDRAKALRGTVAVTYDTDRRVGCSWNADTEDGAHRLVLDVERVVSYDPTVSDAARAQEVYTRKQLAAGIAVPVTPTPTPTTPATPATPATPTGPTTAPATSGTATTPSPTGTTTGTGATGTPPADAAAGTAAGTAAFAASGAPPSPTGTGTGTPTSPTPPTSPTTPPAPTTTGLEPRLLSGLGDIAFVGDTLTPTAGDGHQRVVSVVFRTSNVIVTVEYRQRTAGAATAPDSKELQDRAQNLARLLADRLEE
ncbi:DUF3558 domain-containing protein [Streptomyces sp. NPDC058486]|uniref:DUF3558 domain-containing protein n=1 Tax=unclassified Streptomyces TaxID=2593676 RepID=UPI003667C017